MTIDGVDFRINEPIPFSKEWFSHKFKGPGLRYEVAVCIKTGDIVAYHGPFPAGSFSDLKIFRLGTKPALGLGEMVVADRGYEGDAKTCTPNNYKNEEHKKSMSRARARHETINGRIKFWGSMQQVFRHEREKHHLLFRSVLVLVQTSIENGNAPFQVTNYRDPAITMV